MSISALLLLSNTNVHGFAPSPLRNNHHSTLRVSSDITEEGAKTINEDPLGLTPELRMITNAFSNIPDEKTRHKQLLYMANKLPSVEEAVYVPENKVPGCLSTVHVTCDAKENEDGKTVMMYRGDSDGLLTKGLLALLVRGLSGCTADEIQLVNPEFIKEAKISQTLTPGRNNGFLNMLAVMKKKALTATSTVSAEESDASPEAEEGAEAGESDDNIVISFDEIDGKPMYNAMLSTLIPILKPTYIELVDNSHQHAGHAGSKGWEESGESHFELKITASAFENLNLVKRHQLIYMLLGDIMNKIHALSIVARTPEEEA